MSCIIFPGLHFAIENAGRVPYPPLIMKGIQLIESPVARVSGAAPFNFRPFSGQTPLSRSCISNARTQLAGQVIGGLKIGLTDVLAANPVLLLQAAGGPVIVDGHLRMTEAHRAGVSSLPAFLLPENTARDLVIFHTLSGRAAGLSDVERLIAVQKTGRYARYGFSAPDGGGTGAVQEHLISLYSHLFSRELTVEYLERALGVLEFPADELALLHVLDVPLDQLASLLDLNARERRGLLLLRGRIPMTASESRKLVRLFLSVRGPASQRRFDMQRWVAEKISSYDSRTRGKDLLAEFRTHSHPTLSKREDEIDTTIRSLRFPPSITLRPPENLEGDVFSCYFKFSSVKDIEDHLRRIRNAIDEGTVEKLIGDLNGD